MLGRCCGACGSSTYMSAIPAIHSSSAFIITHPFPQFLHPPIAPGLVHFHVEGCQRFLLVSNISLLQYYHSETSVPWLKILQSKLCWNDNIDPLWSGSYPPFLALLPIIPFQGHYIPVKHVKVSGFLIFVPLLMLFPVQRPLTTLYLSKLNSTAILYLLRLYRYWRYSYFPY